MADVTKKKRSRAGIIGYMNKLIKGDIAKRYGEYKSEHLMTLMCYKDTIEEKLKSVLIIGRNTGYHGRRRISRTFRKIY